MIETKHLKLILAIDQMGSLNKASKALNLTQSALSHQLKNLEEYLELALFSRVGNQLYFTEAGKVLRDKARTILAQIDSLETRMEEIRDSQMARYIHGYSQQEAQRLADQANSVADFLHFDSYWPEGSRVLEVGCGVGAQTLILAKQNPLCQFHCIDIAAESLELAKASAAAAGLTNVSFSLQDVEALCKQAQLQYDHLFVCFVLEHLTRPQEILSQLKRILRPGGTITVIEGDHGSTFFYPDNPAAQKVVKAQVELQKQRGGNANIGRELYPLLAAAAYQDIQVSPRQIYVDPSKPKLVEGFIRNTFTAMIKGMGTDLINEKLVSSAGFDAGIKGLLRTSEGDGVFSYTFFKATAALKA